MGAHDEAIRRLIVTNDSQAIERIQMVLKNDDLTWEETYALEAVIKYLEYKFDPDYLKGEKRIETMQGVIDELREVIAEQSDTMQRAARVLLVDEDGVPFVPASEATKVMIERMEGGNGDG